MAATYGPLGFTYQGSDPPLNGAIRSVDALEVQPYSPDGLSISYAVVARNGVTSIVVADEMTRTQAEDYVLNDTNGLLA